jgi:hypothetical protein
MSSKPIAIAGAVCCGAWISIIYHTIRMARSILPGVRYSNRNNVIFSPADLTPQGRKYRERLILSLLMFPLSIWLGIVFEAMTD